MSTAIKVPDIGDSEAVEVIEVLVAEGDSIEKEQSLLVLESDKATMEIPSEVAGTLEKLHVRVGDKIAQGDVIADLKEATQDGDDSSGQESADTPAEPANHSDDDASEAQDSQQKSEKAEEPVTPESKEKDSAASSHVAQQPDPLPAQPEAPPKPQPNTEDLPHASPSIRLLARELGVDLQQVDGSGRKGRILKEDVQQFVKTALQSDAAGAAVPQMPAVDFSKFGETESRDLSRIRKLSASNLHRNWLVVPHVTQFESADITELEQFRKAESASGDIKLTLLPFVIKAVAVALRQQPDFNSSLSQDGSSLILKKYCNVGFAADTPNGLVVPVLRDVWQKNVSELAQEAAELAEKARSGKLSPAEMQGGCFSVSSLGGIGGSFFTPIINAPEVAILGVSRARTEAQWDGTQFQPRTILPLSLSYDHRVIDGAAAARFAVLLSQLLSDVRRLCL